MEPVMEFKRMQGGHTLNLSPQQMTDARKLGLGYTIHDEHVVPTTDIRANTIRKLKDKYPNLLLRHCANPHDPSDAEFMAMAGELEALCAELKLNAEYLKQLLRPVVVELDESKIEATVAAKRRLLEEGLQFVRNYGGPGTGWTPEDQEQSQDRLDRINKKFKELHPTRLHSCSCNHTFPYKVGPAVVACPACGLHHTTPEAGETEKNISDEPYIAGPIQPSGSNNSANSVE